MRTHRAYMTFIKNKTRLVWDVFLPNTVRSRYYAQQEIAQTGLNSLQT